jgi:hypothetical protein
MKVGIVQVDGHYPNLALMQIAGYHESLGDEVEWYKGGLFDHEYSKVYASKIFSFSEMPPLPADAIVGGTGLDFKNVLPPEISDCSPSYSLYRDCDYHVGFSMKGCRFNCKFCCVPQKEGRPKFNAHIDSLLLNPNGGDRLMLLDNDFFGGPEWKQNLERIIELKLKICFIQGLNIRIITSEQAELISKSRYYNSKFNQRYLTFAWDRFNDGKLVMKGIKICNDAGIPNTKMQFFILIGFDSTKEQDYQRVMTLREMGCMPFVMPYNKNDPYQKAFTRWVNNRAVFKACSWEDYKYNA